jgi:tetratricopeptide (TPR) repeat protein
VEAEILYQTGAPPQSSYTFKHVLLQDTAYASLLKIRRRELHARIAKILTERFPRRAAAEPELLAHHCAAGGLLSEAIEAYRRAGDQAAARIAYREACGYFARALELLAALPQETARDEKEIELRTAQIGPLSALRGFDDPELRASVERTDALIAALGPGPQQIPGLIKLMLLHTNRLSRAREYANALLAVAEPLDIAPLCMAGYIIRGTAAITGVGTTVPEACADLKRAHEIAETLDLPPPKTAFEIDALAMGSATYAIALVAAGKPETAASYAERGIRRARELAHPRTFVSAGNLAAMSYHLAGNARRVGEIAEECLKETEGRGFHQVEVLSRILAGWARAQNGDSEAVAGMDEALESAEARGVVAGMPRFYLASAEVHLDAGRFARALEQAARAQAFMERYDAGSEPEVAQVRGQILLESGELDEADAVLQRAAALFERRQSRWLLLHVATLLGRIALLTGKGKAEAHGRLATLYASFDEGLETERLQGARRVMDLLG